MTDGITCNRCGCKTQLSTDKDGTCFKCTTGIEVQPAICFTGHRKFKNGEHPQLRTHLSNVVHRAGCRGYTTVITGGAIGLDQIAFLSAKDVMTQEHWNLGSRMQYNIVALPFPSYGSNWKGIAVTLLFERMLKDATHVVYCQPNPYHVMKLNYRNEWMIEHSGVVVAVWEGRQHGGTWNAINYALMVGRKVLHINPLTLEERWLTSATAL